MISLKLKMLIVLIVLISATYIGLSHEKNTKLDKYLNKTKSTYINFYESTYFQHKEQAELIYELLINKNEIIDIYKALQRASEFEKDRLRDKLYSLVKDNYIRLEAFDIRQLHFHLSNNDSFLRMHKPLKYGDNLTNVRETIAYVNKNNKKIDGFEEGRIYNGFRFVFPIVDEKGNHLGSVESSYSANTFIRRMMQTYKVDGNFLVSKKVIDEKVFISEKSNYISSPFKDFYYDKQVLKEIENSSFTSKTDANLHIDLMKTALKYVAKGEAVSLYDHTINKIATFMPITNPITNEFVAFIVIKSSDAYMQNKQYNFYAAFIVSSLLILFIVLFIYREINNQMMKRKILIEKNIEMEVEVTKAKQTLEKSLGVFSRNVIASDTDINGVITYVSVALCEISGYSKDELIGKPHSILRHKDTSAKLFKEMWHNLEQELPWSGEIKNMKKDGGFYWVRTLIYTKYDEDEKLVGYSSIRNDITSEKVKEEFMSKMSHELRTPLNAIIGFSSILNKKQTEVENKELSATIKKSALSLLSLINDILDLAKIEDSNFTIKPYEFNAYEELIKFSEQFDGLTHKKTLQYNINIDNTLKGVFYGDWGRISQIILNLISNAIKFTPKDGLIEINGDYKDDRFILSISDNGIGMNKEVQDTIFEPFTQADGSTTRKYGGTGLGLSITQNLVILMNGVIKLESTEGEGTTFIVTIPLKKIRTEEEIQAKEDIEVLSKDDKENTLKGHILIVEDNKTNQMLLRMFIEDFGLTCDIANDGLEAIAVYDPQKHQLVLMDENMPNLNGIESMRAIREKYKEGTTPIIAVTANAMKGDKEKFLSLGMDAYLSKPIDEEELYKLIKSFLYS